METFIVVCLVVALILFVARAFNMATTRIELTALGLAFVTLALLAPALFVLTR